MKLESTSDEDTIRKKELEITLQKLESHPDPSPDLEQYMTPGDVAATLLYMAYSHGSIKEKTVCDLGCGTGRLAIGAALLGADKVLGIDIDEDAIEIARKNAEEAGVGVEWEGADVRQMKPKKFDTVIQNPPFGVQRRGADMDFLEKALKMGEEIYSIHKAVPENREFISERAKKLGGEVTHRREEELHIPAQFKFHDQEVYRFKIDIYKILRR